LAAAALSASGWVVTNDIGIPFDRRRKWKCVATEGHATERTDGRREFAESQDLPLGPPPSSGPSDARVEAISLVWRLTASLVA
jgi:hypothetical protein